MRANGSPLGRLLVLIAGAAALAGCKERTPSAPTPSPTATTTQSQGQGQGQITPKIYLGKLVAAGRLRAVVGLTYNSARTPWCTGALIAEDMVLTAAHCVCEGTPTHVFLGEDPLDTGTNGGKFFTVAGRRAFHGCRATSSTGVDVAVVRINGRIQSAKPFPIAANAPPSGTIFLAAGYGATDREGTTTDYKKREAPVPMTSASCSGAGEAALHGCQPGEEIVAGRINSADTCRGDSGGPLMMAAPGTGSSAEANLVIAGVTSRGVKSTSKCGAGGIYEAMRPDVRTWIADTITQLRPRP